MRTSLVAALFACFLVVPLAAQDRMPPIATDQLTDAQKKAADEFSQGRGYAVRGPFVPLIRSLPRGLPQALAPPPLPRPAREKPP